MSICNPDNGCDLDGGYFANCNPNPRWGAGVRFPSQAACYRACVDSGDAGCGNCSYVPACPEVPPEPPIVLLEDLDDKKKDDKKGMNPMLIIIGAIVFILLLRR